MSFSVPTFNCSPKDCCATFVDLWCLDDGGFWCQIVPNQPLSRQVRVQGLHYLLLQYVCFKHKLQNLLSLLHFFRVCNFYGLFCGKCVFEWQFSFSRSISSLLLLDKSTVSSMVFSPTTSVVVVVVCVCVVFPENKLAWK